MLSEAELSKRFWAEAVNYSVYLLNRSPSAGIGMTPEQAWTGKVPSLSHIRTFHIPKQQRRKWDAKSHQCILVGFDDKTKYYKLYDRKKDIVLKSRNVAFMDEGRSPSSKQEKTQPIYVFSTVNLM